MYPISSKKQRLRSHKNLINMWNQRVTWTMEPPRTAFKFQREKGAKHLFDAKNMLSWLGTLLLRSPVFKTYILFFANLKYTTIFNMAIKYSTIVETF